MASGRILVGIAPSEKCLPDRLKHRLRQPFRTLRDGLYIFSLEALCFFNEH